MSIYLFIHLIFLFFSETFVFSGGIKSEATVSTPLKFPFPIIYIYLFIFISFYFINNETPSICAVHFNNSILKPPNSNNLNFRSNFMFFPILYRRWESKNTMILCLGLVGGSTKCLQLYDSSYRINNKKFLNLNNNNGLCFNTRWRFLALESDSSPFASSVESDATDKNAAATGWVFWFFLLHPSF